MSKVEILFEIVLLVIAIVASGLAITTGIKVFRLRNKRISWRAGTLAGYPLFASIFLLVSFILLGVMCQFSGTWNIISASIYVLISCAWFTASYFSSKHYITDYGIVKNINEPAQTVAWHQIYDFFEHRRDDNCCFVFIYHENKNQQLSDMVRLQLDIPERKLEDFKNLISHKLGRRLKCFNHKSFDLSELEDI